MSSNPHFENFTEFYHFYLGEHRQKATRYSHFIGTFSFLTGAILAGIVGQWAYLLAGVVTAYALAWFSHFFFEKNRPATFKYPLFSLAADFVLFFDLLRGKQKFGC